MRLIKWVKRQLIKIDIWFLEENLRWLEKDLSYYNERINNPQVTKTSYYLIQIREEIKNDIRQTSNELNSNYLRLQKLS